MPGCRWLIRCGRSAQGQLKSSTVPRAGSPGGAANSRGETRPLPRCTAAAPAPSTSAGETPEPGPACARGAEGERLVPEDTGRGEHRTAASPSSGGTRRRVRGRSAPSSRRAPPPRGRSTAQGARPPSAPSLTRPGGHSPPRRSVRLYMPGCPRARGAGPRRSFVIRSAPSAAGGGSPHAAPPALPSRCARGGSATPLPAARSRGAAGRQGRAGAASRSSPRQRAGAGQGCDTRPKKPAPRRCSPPLPTAPRRQPGPSRSGASQPGTRSAPRTRSPAHAAPHTQGYTLLSHTGTQPPLTRSYTCILPSHIHVPPLSLSHTHTYTPSSHKYTRYRLPSHPTRIYTYPPTYPPTHSHPTHTHTRTPPHIRTLADTHPHPHTPQGLAWTRCWALAL